MDERHGSPLSTAYESKAARRTRFRRALTCLLGGLVLVYFILPSVRSEEAQAPPDAGDILARCELLKLKPGPPANFHSRSASERYVPGTPPVLIRNARIWTGAQNGTEVVRGSVLLSKGVIRAVGRTRSVEELVDDPDDDWKNLVVVDAKGAWVTPGIVDLHSHVGVGSSPMLEGASFDDNSYKGPIVPWLRALDALNTHDDAYTLSVAGGVTTALILPGSANAIAGQGFTIKLRKTAERTPTSMLLEPPFQINGSLPGPRERPRWRHMKQACGENPSNVYGNTRMDNMWAMRQAYDKARQIKEDQDAYCSIARRGDWSQLRGRDFPDDLQWEAMVDILRGKVKVQTHCYEAVDLDDLVRLSNEFKFPLAAVHHAHEAYLVADRLKEAYGGPPAAAIFATFARYKREAWRGSEFAPRILANHGIPVVMKSDHPVIDERYLLYEAQQAFFYGLPANLAIASVTSTPAQVMGMAHRIGYIRPGWDADLVIWDSHPLALGATPIQVYIDGAPQLENPSTLAKPAAFEETPEVPDFDDEAYKAIEYDGLPPLLPKASTGDVLFVNVQSVIIRTGSEIEAIFTASSDELGSVLVQGGKISCTGSRLACMPTSLAADVTVIDLRGGALQPSLVSYGASLGLVEIEQEPSTNDAFVMEPLLESVPKILGGDGAVMRAVDGLAFQQRNSLLAYRAGVSMGITAPHHASFTAGLSVAFSLGARDGLEHEAIIQPEAALHVAVGHFGVAPSVSTQIGALRRLLLGGGEGESGKRFKAVALGQLTLVVEAKNADVIASLISLKKSVEKQTGTELKMTITGATEAHLLAAQLKAADISVIMSPIKQFPLTWEMRHILPGPPLSEQTALTTLLAHGVTVGVSNINVRSPFVDEAWKARNLRFDLAWAALDANGTISRSQLFALASTNLERALGLEARAAENADLVATVGGDIWSMSSKVVGVVSPRRGLVDLW